MLVEVENPSFVPGSDSPATVPAAFVVGSGEKTHQKKYLVNQMICDWQVRYQKVRISKKKECPFYQPSAQNQHLRTFFGAMKKHYDWQWADSDFKGFRGCLHGVIEELYCQRRLQYVRN